MSDADPGGAVTEALRRANPVPDERTAGRRSQPSAHALFAGVVAQRPRRVRRRPLVLLIAIVVLVLLLAGFVAVRRTHASLPLGTSCYTKADLGAPKVIVGSGASPAAACAQLWRTGQLGTGSVPSFDTCVLPSGVIAVFPGESGSVCARLGLPEQSGNNDVAAFADQVNRQVSGACIGADAAEKIINRALAAHGFHGWTVKRGAAPFDDAEPCASLAFDVARRTITLIAIPSPFVTPSTTP